MRCLKDLLEPNRKGSHASGCGLHQPKLTELRQGKPFRKLRRRCVNPMHFRPARPMPCSNPAPAPSGPITPVLPRKAVMCCGGARAPPSACT